MSVAQYIKQFKTDGIMVLDELSEDKYVTLITKTNNAYYNNKPLMTDNEFNIVKEYFDR